MNKKLKNLFKLSSKITVYIPATVNINEEANNTIYVEKCAALLSELFGGATSSSALGYWSSPTVGLVKENTTLIFAYCAENDLKNGIDKVVAFCENLKEELKQESIALEINGEMYFI